MGPRIEEKKHLSAKGLLNKIQNFFCTIKNPVKGSGSGKAKISLADCLMSGLAIFGLKMPSLLQFDLRKNEENVKHNLKTLYQVEETPCDTYLRERLDNLDPQEIRGAFTSVFSSLQRGKVLEKYEFIDKHYLLLCDGTGFFSSKQVHCKNCCEKKHKNGTTTYHHMMLGAAIAHPNYPEVIPLCPEPIQKKDGSKKNDCERNACKRFLTDLRREHPHLPLILAEDGLSANAPHLRLCKEHNIRFISVVKKEGNKTLFEWIKNINSSEKIIYDKNGKMIHKIRFYNGIPLNNADPDFEVNFLEYWEYNSQGEEIYYNTWVTDIEIIEANALEICRGGRARWKIENETFNTLKNQGYNFEHNYGHGNNNLCTIFGMLMVLAFLIDQVQQICCGLFQAAWKKLKSKKALWERLRGSFILFKIESWKILYEGIIYGLSNNQYIPNSS